MTHDSTKVLSGWRVDIAAELDEAKNALTAVESEYTTASEIAEEVRQACHEMQRTLGVFGRLASPLAQRSTWHQNGWTTAKSRAALAHANLETARNKIIELERAIQQIDHLLTPADEEAA